MEQYPGRLARALWDVSRHMPYPPRHYIPLRACGRKLPLRRPTHYPVIIMNAIVDVRVATNENSTITAMELLEEFADSTPSWSYLEDDTRYYSESRGCPACVLSHA